MADQTKEAVAWIVAHKDGGSHVLLADTVDARFREVLTKNGRTVRPLVYGDTRPPTSATVVEKVARALARENNSVSPDYDEDLLWSFLDDRARAHWRRLARAALAAMGRG